MELADQQVSENEALVADVPAEAPDIAAPAAASEKPEKLSLREQIVRNVETVRTEEAKRARAADGKFAKLEAGAAEKPATNKPLQSEKTDAQPEPASKSFAPPPGFSPETKAFLATLPPDHPIKRDIEKREGEVSNGIKTYSDKAKQYDAIDQVFAPVRSTYQQAGIQSDADAIKVLLGWEAGFRNPATREQSFQNLARQYGFNLQSLVPRSQSGSPSAAQDIPEPLRPVIDQFGHIQQTVQDVASRVQSWEQNNIAEKLTSFAKDKPHFEAVRATMGQLMQAGIVQPGDLDGAYQKAIAIHPEVSAQIKADEEKNRQAELAKANAEKLKRASTAAVSPSARPPSGQAGAAAPKSSSVRESLLSNIKALREEQRA